MSASREDRHAEFYELERIAMRLLALPHTIVGAPTLDGWFLKLRLWHYPSFAAHRSWAIYQKNERAVRGARTLVRQAAWDYPSDAKRLLEPLTGLAQGFHTKPTIEVRDRSLATDSFENRVSILRAIVFPAFCGPLGGLDGEFFGVAFPDHGGANVEWWCGGPESWRELTDWAAEMREWFSAIAENKPKPEPGTPPHLP